MEGVEGGEGDGGVDSDIVLADPEDGGARCDKFAWRIWVGTVQKPTGVWRQMGWF